MKKIFLFAALCSAMMVSAATEYCNTPLTATDGDAAISCYNVAGNTYCIKIVAEGDMIFNHAQNVNFGINQSAGAGIFLGNDKWSFSTDGKEASVTFETASESSVPTNSYGNYMCFSKSGGKTARDLVEFTFEATDVDWTATCGGVVEDDEKPVLVSAELVSHDYQSAVIAVEATDNVGVLNYLVNEGETENFGTEVGTFMAKDGQITVTGLTPSTNYTLWIYAKDAAGNKSTAKSVTLTTDDFSYCNIPTGHEGNPNFGDANGRILLSLTKKDGNTVTVTVKPNYENGATRKLDYLYVAPKDMAPITTGADIVEGGEDELSVDVEYVTMPDVLNFHLEWSNPGWPGRWAADITNVGIATLCKTTPTAINTIESASVVSKRVINGQLVITIDGINYTAQGQVIK